MGVEPATYWSPVGRRIQLSHRGWLARNWQLPFLNQQKVETDQIMISQKGVGGWVKGGGGGEGGG